jgi:perosamine synthetase
MAAYDYESNFLTVHSLGARPVLVDVDPHNWNLDPTRLEAAFGPHTKAVVCSHLHGGLVPMRAVMELDSRWRGMGVVEDAAQAAGAVVQGQPAGTWGGRGGRSVSAGRSCFRLGRGGAILVRDPHLFQRARVWLHRGAPTVGSAERTPGRRGPAPTGETLAAATAHRVENVRALIHLMGQVYETIPSGNTNLETRAVRETDMPLTVVPCLVSFTNPAAADSIPAYYKVGFRFDASAFGLTRDLFVRALRAEGVAFDPGFNAFARGPVAIAVPVSRAVGRSHGGPPRMRDSPPPPSSPAPLWVCSWSLRQLPKFTIIGHSFNKSRPWTSALGPGFEPRS